MINASLAIGDFMVMLVSAIFWAGLGIAGWVLIGAGAIGGALLVARRLVRYLR